MIGRADDYPIHQTPDPVAVAGNGARDFSERYFFNGYARDGSVFFAATMGQYPNRGVVDAAFSVVYRGRQHVVRASRRAGGERMDTQVGPIAVEVIEPLRTLRVLVRPNAWEVAADLAFTARAGVIEEPRLRREVDGPMALDRTRLTQHIEVRGQIRLGGETLELTPERHWGSRTRSWGIRPLDEHDPDAGTPPQGIGLWAPVHFDDLCTHFVVAEGAAGTRSAHAGMIVPVGGEPELAADADCRLQRAPGTGHARSAVITLRRASGERLEIELTPLYPFFMAGLGHAHPVWGHGMPVGDDVADGESWALADIDPTAPSHRHIQALCTARLGDRRGIGVLEQRLR